MCRVVSREGGSRCFDEQETKVLRCLQRDGGEGYNWMPKKSKYEEKGRNHE